MLMDLLALGSSLDDRSEDCSSTMPLYPTGGQWLPLRGRDTVKYYLHSPPLCAYLEFLGLNPKPGIKICTKIFVSKRWMFFHSCKLSYQIFLPCSFYLVSHLTLPSFLPPSSTFLWQKSHRCDVIFFYLSISYPKVHQWTCWIGSS